MNTEYTIKSWADAQDKLFNNTFDEKINRYRSSFSYRTCAGGVLSEKVPLEADSVFMIMR